MSEQDKNPQTEAEQAAEPTLRQAKPGVKDEGDTVTTAGGVTMSGLIADIADGDS